MMKLSKKGEKWNFTIVGRITTFEEDLGVNGKVRFVYDGEIDPKTGCRHGFGRYYDFVNFKVAIGYFYQDLPYGKQVVYIQNDALMVK